MISKVRLCLGEPGSCRPPRPSEANFGETWVDGEGRESGYAVQSGDEFWLRLHNIGFFRLQAGHEGITGFPEEGVDLWSFRDAFFHGVLPWILQKEQWECLHGSAVLAGTGVIGFCGPSGRGKSTLARAWSARGGGPYGDDTMAFLIRDGVAQAARIPQRPRLLEPAASHYPDRSSSALDGFVGGQLFHDLDGTLRPLTTIYWMEPMAEPGSSPIANLERVSGEEAFSLLLGEARLLAFTDPKRRRKVVGNYLALVRSTPVFRLSIAGDIAALPSVLDALERHQQELSQS